jgi:integrase
MCAAIPLFDAPAEPKGRTGFFLPAEFERLHAAAAAHIKPLLVFLICTGCRMSEAVALEWPEVDLAGGRVILWEGETKGGRRRVVDLTPAATAALTALPHRTGEVFRTHRGAAYRRSQEGDSGGQIKKSWAAACVAAGIAGQTPHNLRHSWATWQYALKPDLLALKVAGGWSSVVLVEKYAHLMPAGHEAGIRRVWGIVSDKSLARNRQRAS